MFVKPITFLVTERFNAKIILSGPLLPSLFGTLFSSFDRRILFLPHWLVVRGLSGRPRVSATAHHGIQRPGTPQGQNGQQVIEFGGEKQTAVLYHHRQTPNVERMTTNQGVVATAITTILAIATGLFHRCGRDRGGDGMGVENAHVGIVLQCAQHEKYH